MKRDRVCRPFVASENIRTGAALVSYLFRRPRRLVEARREVFLVVNLSVCFRRGSSQGEAVLVRDRFDVEFNLFIGGLDEKNCGFFPFI